MLGEDLPQLVAALVAEQAPVTPMLADVPAAAADGSSAIPGGVPNVEDYVLRVEQRTGPDTIDVIYQR